MFEPYIGRWCYVQATGSVFFHINIDTFDNVENIDKIDENMQIEIDNP